MCLLDHTQHGIKMQVSRNAAYTVTADGDGYLNVFDRDVAQYRSVAHFRTLQK